MSETSPVEILVVDDDPLVLETMVTALIEGGYAPLRAQSSAEAFDILAARHGDLGGLVTDVNLGRYDVSGWEIATRARELNPEMPVVYVSGDSAGEWAAHGVPKSILLQKPFALADLVVAVASARETR